MYAIMFAITIGKANAQDTLVVKNDTTNLNEVTVVAVRAEDNSPITQTNITKKEIQKNYFGQDLPVLLSKTPAFNMYSDGGTYNGYMYIRLRGIDQTRINMTLNGVPLNEPEDQGAYFSNFTDFGNNINSAQVQRGVGMSTNGVSSFAGSINFESHNLLDSNNTNLQAGYGSFNSKRYSVGYNSGLKKKTAFYARYSNSSTDGYRKFSGTNANTFFFSAGYYGKKDILKFTSFTGNSKNQMAYLASPIDSINLNAKHNPLTTNEYDDFTQSLSMLQWTHRLGINSTITTSAYYNYLRGDYDVAVPSTMLNFRLKSNFYGVISNYKYSKNKFKFDAGVHANSYDRTHSMVIKPDISTNIYKNTGYKKEASAFIKASYNLFDKLLVYADIQGRVVSFDYLADTSTHLIIKPITWSFINPKAGLNYKINNTFNLYGFVGQTHREPTRTDMFGGADDVDTNNVAVVGNLSRVKPEQVTDYEVGFNITTNKLKVQLNGYHMQFKNEIAAIGQLSYIGLPLRKNVAESYRRGVELNVQYSPIKWLGLWANGNYMVAKIKSYTDDNTNTTYKNVSPLLTPNVIVNGGCDIKFNYLRFGIDARYISKQYLANNGDNNFVVPESYVSNAHVTGTYKNASLSVALNNITNIRYFNSGYTDGTSSYYYISAPRNFYITLNLNF